MTFEDIIARLNHPGVPVDRLLDETRAPDLSVWREHPELYPAFVRRLLEQGHPGRALELGREGQAHLSDNLRLRYLLALAAARGGGTRYAEALLAPLLSLATDPAGPPPGMDDALRIDVIALQGRLLKDRSEREPALAADSARWYERAAGAAPNPEAAVFPLTNAATMWRVAGDAARSESLASEVARLVGGRAEEAASAGNLWPAASLGEALLLLGRHDEAIHWYRRAVEVANQRGDVGNLVSLRNNLRRLKAVGATAESAFLDEQLGRVVVFSGHLLDSPERRASGAPPRFPRQPALVSAVESAIREKVEALNAKVGYCSLGCGGDILFAEAMLDRGAELHVVLPFGQQDFRRTSVDFGQDAAEWRGWRRRFDSILDRVERESKSRVHYVTHEPYLGSRELFEFANTVLQGLAVLRSRERASEPAALVLIDRSSADSAGGTADFTATWVGAGYRAEEINLAAIRAAHPAGTLPQEAPAPPPVLSALARPVKAMLFADVAGYSAIPEWQLPAFLTAYGQRLRELFGSAVGKAAVYANTWGDGLYVVFDRAADAAAFALELVEPTSGRSPDWSAFGLGPTNPMRVGLHTGPVFELRDLFQGRSEFAGQHVNRAARIEPVTVRGCAYASEPFAAMLTMHTPGRFAVETVGVHSLAKNYDRCPLYRIQRVA
jgi:tetratricopeptide (TPR) repeat protein